MLVIGRGSNLLVADAGFEGVGGRARRRVHASIEIAAEACVVDGCRGGCRSRCWRADRQGRDRGTRVLRRHPRKRRRRGAHERGRPRSGDTETCRRAAASSISTEARGPCVPPRRARPRLPPLGARTASGRGRGDVRQPQPTARACGRRIDEIVRWRREHQPGGQNAGSVFTNPPGDAAGRLIDACGLKGLRVGGVVVSEKHANFFAASPGARADDVLALMRLVQSRVEAETGVRLEPELRLIGFAPGSRRSDDHGDTDFHPTTAPRRRAAIDPRIRSAGSRCNVPSARRRLRVLLVVSSVLSRPGSRSLDDHVAVARRRPHPWVRSTSRPPTGAPRPPGRARSSVVRRHRGAARRVERAAVGRNASVNPDAGRNRAHRRSPSTRPSRTCGRRAA